MNFFDSIFSFNAVMLNAANRLWLWRMPTTVAFFA